MKTRQHCFQGEEGGGGGGGKNRSATKFRKNAPQVCNFLYSFVQDCSLEETFLLLFVSRVEPQPFVPVHPGLASIFNITTALHAEFLTAFVQFSGHFFRICTKSIQPLRTRKFRTCCDFRGRKFQNMPWQVKKFVSSRVPKLLRFGAAIQFPAFANEVHLLTRFFEKVDPSLPSRLMMLIRQPLKKKNGCKLIKNRIQTQLLKFSRYCSSTKQK